MILHSTGGSIAVLQVFSDGCAEVCLVKIPLAGDFSAGAVDLHCVGTGDAQEEQDRHRVTTPVGTNRVMHDKVEIITIGLLSFSPDGWGEMFLTAP